MKRTTSIILCLLSGMILPTIWSNAAAQDSKADAEARAKLSKALTLHASFDKGLDADFARGGGEKTCYLQQGAKLIPAKPNEEVKLAADAGRFGGALYFPKKGTTRPS